MANKRICDSCGAEAAPEDQECAVCEGIVNEVDSTPAPKKAKKEKEEK